MKNCATNKNGKNMMVMKVIIIILHIDQGQFVGNAQVDQNDNDHVTALEYEKIVNSFK